MTQQQSKTPRRQTIEQERGQGAWSCIKDIKDLAKKEQQEYRSLARGLNPMIQVNGLGQSLGFFYAKSRDEKTGRPDLKKAHYRILNHLTNWMIGHFTPSAILIGKHRVWRARLESVVGPLQRVSFHLPGRVVQQKLFYITVQVSIVYRSPVSTRNP